jgi:hypothetical protein
MSRETDSTNSFNEYIEEKKLIWERQKLGLELRHKFDLYFVTLIFTLLGLAIQTANKSSALYINYAEIIGWGCLFISGLVALYGLSKLWIREIGVAEVKYRQFFSSSTEELSKEVQGIENRIKRSGKTKSIFFLIGISALMLSRGSQLIVSTSKAQSVLPTVKQD